MFDLRFLLPLALVLAAASAMPADKTRQLSEMFNKTVCAIKVETDENPDRIPQHIKMIKCADRPKQGCESNNIQSYDCCHENHDMACVEITDMVQVYHKKSKKQYQMVVSVGCVCMIEHITEAPGLPPPKWKPPPEETFR